MAKRMTVHLDGQSIYDIVMGDSFRMLEGELEALKIKERKVCIVSDENVAAIYLREVKNILALSCAKVGEFVFPAGEEYKTLDTVRNLYEFLIQNKYDRKDLLVALGGGVTGDLCGFAAATYLRGISFIQLPTTLLAQVDSGIGGKTGVDFDAYKNMIGAFYMPKLVYINSAALLTLPENQFASGMGEVVKHGLIKSRDYYDWIWENREAIRDRDLESCQRMIWQSVIIKRDVVEKDPRELGERALLNYGHTLGHAIEKLKDFTLLHGHCVALGSLAAAFLSADRGMLSTADCAGLSRRLQFFGLPVTLSGLAKNDIIKVTKSDKKMDAGRIRFILLQEIGKGFVDTGVTEEEMDLALSALIN